MFLFAMLLAVAAPQCDIAHYAPAELLDREEHFRDSLAVVDRARLDRALPRDGNDGVAVCVGQDGAACDAQAYVKAFDATGLMPRFIAGLCPAHRR